MLQTLHLPDRTQLSYFDSGERADTTPVILVHAFPLHQRMWSEQVSALEKITRVITFDIRGFGLSTTESPYTLEFIVDDVVSLLDDLKIDRAIIGGLSMGGYVALRAVERNPERFSGVVLANTRSEPDSDEVKLGRTKALKTIREKGVSEFIDGFIQKALAPSAVIEEPQIYAQAKEIALCSHRSAIETGLLALTSRTDTTPKLSEIRVPTLVLHGEHDQVVPADAARAMHEKIPGSEFHLISQAGHLSNLENSEEFNERLVAFVSALQRSESSGGLLRDPRLLLGSGQARSHS